jgi:hypothetical protein
LSQAVQQGAVLEDEEKDDGDDDNDEHDDDIKGDKREKPT